MMLIFLSPAKTLDFETVFENIEITVPRFLSASENLIHIMQQYSAADISKLMGVSEKIASLNESRFQSWKKAKSLKNGKQALFAFQGDVYTGLDAATLKVAALKKAQAHIRILSGLYGVLKPLDVIMPYRLEMGTRLKNDEGKDLYAFWGNLITDSINEDLQALKSEWVINLASNEYSKVVKLKQLNATVTTPVFKDWKNGQYKMISFYAKKARGMMARYCVEHKVKSEADLCEFNTGGYYFSDSMSKPGAPVFLREEQK